MSNVSIFEKKWIDLVFEGKNKAYGAYQLRQESSKTTLVAFFVSLMFIGALSGLGLLLSSFGSTVSSNPIPDNDDRVIRVDNIVPPKPETETVLPKSNPSTIIVPPTSANQRYEVAPTIQSQPEILNTNPTTPSSGTPGIAPGTGPATGPQGTVGGTEGPAITSPAGPEIAALLDVQPEFPGGIKKFYEYVGRNFEKPEINDMETVSVLVSFVIEKDGSMTDIKVLRNPGYGLDKEAIRVLKSLKTKWKAGIKNGQSVRTQYTLPIKVQVN